MISRRTALALAETYANKFYDSYRSGLRSTQSKRYRVDTEELYDFLFTCNYAAWFCNLIEKTSSSGSNVSSATRTLKEFLMKIHTGESLVQGTPQWTWKQREELGQQYLTNLASDILNAWHKEWKNLEKYEKPDIEEEVARLQKSLELDGYTYKDMHLLIPESDVLDLEEETGILARLFTSLDLHHKETVFHHLKLSEEHYINSKWDDSISNSRKFLEGVLQEVAAKHSKTIKKTDLPDSAYSRPVRVREYLEKESLMERKEVETLAAIYGLLSETGGHPYMAQNDQARLLRHLSLTFAQFVMLRLQGNLMV